MRVNPARAGMILSLNNYSDFVPRKPRASGDDPDAGHGLDRPGE